MVERLQRLLLFTVLFSLVTARHLPAEGRSGIGFWEILEQSDFALFMEEEAESESETEELHETEGGDDDEPISNHNEVTCSANKFPESLFTDFVPNYLITPCRSLTKFRVEASNLSLANSYKPHLYLLFHNIKSDLAHPAA